MSNEQDNVLSVILAIKEQIGVDRVCDDEKTRRLMSQDVFTRQHLAAAVVRPKSTDELSAAVGTATAGGCTVVPRGGGMSYTRAYVPNDDTSIVIDMGAMDRVLEVNSNDMYVRVEAGCTWEALYQALAGTGLRTRYWGTLSGRFSTVGGAMSQNAIFWGSGQFGFAADNVNSMEVVLADGSVVRTGTATQLNAQPFGRHFGPDLTGLFTGDSGALGFKATITMPLIQEYEGKAFCAFDFKTAEDTLQAMSEIARQGLAMECFGFDPCLQSQRLKRESLATDVKALANVIKSSDSVLQSIKDGAQVALKGRRYMNDVDYSVQIMIEDFSQTGADEKARRVCAIAAECNGAEISNSIPKIVRSNPFGPVNAMLGPQGERWVPVHTVVSLTEAVAGHAAIQDIFEEKASVFKEHGIETGFLFTTVGNNAFALEPVFYWPDVATEFHTHYVEEAHMERLPKLEEGFAAREVVAQVRRDIADLFRERGGVHLQIGKDYHYADGVHAEVIDLVRSLKRHVDPQGLVNPGALGL